MTTLESTTERLEEALRRLAVEAADLFEELLARGAELPFDLEPSDQGPLPMISYGGTALLSMLAGFGILMSISTHKQLVSS